MNLKKYFQVVDTTPMAFSRICELHPALIYKILYGNCRIDVKTALLIEKMTNGDVSLLELCDNEFLEKIKRLKSPYRKIRKVS